MRDVTNYIIVPVDMLLASLSFISNFLVLTAVWRTPSLRHPSLLLLCSLSVTDLLWAFFCIVKDTLRYTQEDFCPEGTGISGKEFPILCYMSTLGNLAIISRDRHLAVGKPLWYRNHMTRSRIVKQTSAVWLFSAIMSGLAHASLHFSIIARLPQVLAALFYVTCIVVMIYSYAGMNQHGGQMCATLKRETKLANTVGLILIVLCFTFLPGLMTPMVLLTLGFSAVSEFIPSRPFYFLLITLNGLLNPLLNYGRNKDVRRAVRGLVRCRQCVGTVHPYNTGSHQRNQHNPSPAAAISLEQRSCPTH